MNALLAILNVFIDPAETVRRIRGNKTAWFLPILLGGVVMAMYSHTLPRMTMQAMRNDPPPGIDAAKLDQMVSSMEFLARFSTITAPIFFALMALIGAALIFGTCVVLQVNVKFPDLYNLVAHVSIINAVQTLAHLVILRGKGDSVTMHDLVPNFGLGLLLGENPPKLLYGAATFFSLFTVWHIVVLAIGLAALANVPKGKAFLATAPNWVLGLIFALIGAMFRK